MDNSGLSQCKGSRVNYSLFMFSSRGDAVQYPELLVAGQDRGG